MIIQYYVSLLDSPSLPLRPALAWMGTFPLTSSLDGPTYA